MAHSGLPSRGQTSKMEVWTAEIKGRARRRIGEISKGLEKEKPGVKSKLSPSGGTQSKRETLEEAGIAKSIAHRCEKLTEIPESRMEEMYAEAREKNNPNKLIHNIKAYFDVAYYIE